MKGYNNFMKAKQVMSKLNITRPTLCKYVKQGTLKVHKLSNGQYDYDEDSVYAFLGIKHKKITKFNISYSRVSTQSQREHLKDQSNRIYESCISRGIRLDKQFEDIKSGMDANRKGFQSVIDLVVQGKVDLLIIENKDRLTRFNFDTLEYIFKCFGTKIIVLNDTLDNKSYEQELIEDFISIIHYFTMKSYSFRRKLNKIRKELEQELSDEHKNNQTSNSVCK